jgi:membrane protease YdiL (CAAX protease family)
LIVALVAGLHHLTGARPEHLGLTTSRWDANLLVGYLGWLVLTPPVLLFYFFLTLWIKPEPHPLQTLAAEEPTIAEWVLLVLQAVLIAPVLEELLFRGLVQRWLRQATMLGHFGVALASLALVVPVASNLVKDWRDILDLDVLLEPSTFWLVATFVLFGLGLLPAYVLLADQAVRSMDANWPPSNSASITTFPREPEADDGSFTASPSASSSEAFLQMELDKKMPLHAVPALSDLVAIYGSAVLFASFHASVWPSPIPLFVLGLGLGWLAYRTQSLVAPIVAHALFNAVACIVLAFEM